MKQPAARIEQTLYHAIAQALRNVTPREAQEDGSTIVATGQHKLEPF